MSAPPFMPLYVADYLGDTGHLTTTEHGAYFLLLMTMWRAGGSLPNDDQKLARFCRCTRAQWDRMRPTLMEFFAALDDSISHKRMSAELTKYTYAVERQRVRSSNGGKAKALKSKKTALPAALPAVCQPEPEPEYKGKPLQGLTLIRHGKEILPLGGQSLAASQSEEEAALVSNRPWNMTDDKHETLVARKALADEARKMLGMTKGRGV